MKVRLVLEGYGVHVLEGEPRRVLEEADRLVVEWKVMYDGSKEG